MAAGLARAAACWERRWPGSCRGRAHRYARPVDLRPPSGRCLSPAVVDLPDDDENPPGRRPTCRRRPSRAPPEPWPWRDHLPELRRRTAMAGSESRRRDDAREAGHTPPHPWPRGSSALLPPYRRSTRGGRSSRSGGGRVRRGAVGRARLYRGGTVQFFFFNIVVLGFNRTDMWGHVHLTKKIFIFATSALTSGSHRSVSLSTDSKSVICPNCNRLAGKW
jgi:hypothetical protein